MIKGWGDFLGRCMYIQEGERGGARAGCLLQPVEHKSPPVKSQLASRQLLFLHLSTAGLLRAQGQEIKFSVQGIESNVKVKVFCLECITFIESMENIVQSLKSWEPSRPRLLCSSYSGRLWVL